MRGRRQTRCPRGTAKTRRSLALSARTEKKDPAGLTCSLDRKTGCHLYKQGYMMTVHREDTGIDHRRRADVVMGNLPGSSYG